jgi:S1-C subfamily serine protease
MFLLTALLACFAAPPLVEKEPPKRAFVGVMLLSPKNSDEIHVLSVVDNAPAAKAGLKPGDVLLRVAGVKPVDLLSTVKLIGSQKIGAKVPFLIRRDGKEIEITVIPAG